MKFCPKCGAPVVVSSLQKISEDGANEYAYQCFDCDEDFYSFEVLTDDERESFRRSSFQSYFMNKALEDAFSFNLQFNAGFSEVSSGEASDETPQMYHIFSANKYPVLSSFVENIIALTPSQHLSLAHPSGHTAKTSPDFQYDCLLSKNETIRKNVLNGFGPAGFYSFDKFAFALDVGLETDYFSHLPQNDFTSVRSGIDSHFNWD